MPLPGISMQPLVMGAAFGGPLFAWGDSSSGHLGDGQIATDFSSPIQIGSQTWKKVSSGGSTAGAQHEGHTLAIRSDGLLFAWGANTSGQLGDGTTTFRSSPVQIGSSRWTDVNAAGAHSLAVREDGLLFTWGQGNVGQLGNGGTGNTSSPIQIGSSSWLQVTGGADNSLAIRFDRLLFAWGVNANGQLGDGSTTQRNSPVQVGSSSWRQVSSRTNAHTSGGIRVDGLLFTWGDATAGRLGDGTTVSKSSPVQIGSSSWQSLSVADASAAIRLDGLLFTWGQADSGEAGNGVTTGAGSGNSSPVQVGSLLWTYVNARPSMAAIRSDGLLFTWGGNGSGQLGDGTIVGKNSPVQVGSAAWVDVSMGCNVAFTSFFAIGLRRLT